MRGCEIYDCPLTEVSPKQRFPFPAICIAVVSYVMQLFLWTQMKWIGFENQMLAKAEQVTHHVSPEKQQYFLFFFKISYSLSKLSYFADVWYPKHNTN